MASISSPAASLPQNPLRGICSAVRIERGAARFIDVRGALKLVPDPSPPAAAASASCVSVGSVASGTSMTTVSSEPDSMVVDVSVTGSSNEHGSATMTRTRNVADSESDVSHGGGDGVAPVLVVQPGAPQSRSQVDVGTTSSGCGIGDAGGQADVAQGTARSSCPIQKPATTTLGNGLWDVEVAALCYTAKYQPAARAGRASMALDWFALGKTMEAVVRHRVGAGTMSTTRGNGWALSVGSPCTSSCGAVSSLWPGR